MKRTIAAVAAVGLACGLLAGCTTAAGVPGSAVAPGSSAAAAPSVTSAPSAPTTACALVSEADATTALGADPGPGLDVQGSAGDATSCAFGESPAILNVTLQPTEGKASFENIKANASAGGLVELTGIGDGALGVSHAPFSSIEFYSGQAFVAIVLGSTDNTARDDQARALALAIIAKL
ncbi:MAG: hypothetical protein ABI632_00225 [Pseudolysinimonas sp.]